MAKKVKRLVKSGPDKASRWTVRGVSAGLQKAAGDQARARGLTLGQWLSATVEAAVAGGPEAPEAGATDWRQTIEARLARLEEAGGAPDRSLHGSDRQSASAPAN